MYKPPSKRVAFLVSFFKNNCNFAQSINYYIGVYGKAIAKNSMKECANNFFRKTLNSF